MNELDNIEKESNPTPFGFFAHQYLCEAIAHAQDEHLRTAGEASVMKRFDLLTIPAQQHYAQLITREKKTFRVEKLLKSGSVRPSVISELQDSQFIVKLPQSPSFMHFGYFTKSELVQLCKVFNCSPKGKKNALISRLLNTDARPPAIYALSHTSIFARCFRKLYSQTTTNWSQPVLASLNEHRHYPYPLTPRFIHNLREQYRTYRLFHKLYTQKNKYVDLPPPPLDLDVPYRFRAHRFYRKYIHTAAFKLEKTDPLTSHRLYQSIQPHFPSILRMLAIFSSNTEPQKLFIQTKNYIKTAALAEAIALYTSLGPICRKKKYRKGMPPDYRPAQQRTMYITPVESGPRFALNEKNLGIENYIIEKIKLSGGRAFFTENHFWNTLKTILFLDAIYSPVAQQLPSPYQNGPLDRYSPLFYERRKKDCERILTQIASGEAWNLFQKNLPLDDIMIMGQHHHQIQLDVYALFFQHVSPHALAQVLRYLLIHPRISGMPDILAFIPATCSCSFVTPPITGINMMFIEAKSQSDTIRPNQIAMHHLLLSVSIPVEIWKQKKL